jgi:hypothetical protein
MARSSLMGISRMLELCKCTSGAGETNDPFGINLVANAPLPAPEIVLLPGRMLSRHFPYKQ